MNLVLIYLGGMAAIGLVASALIVLTFNAYKTQDQEDALDVWKRVMEE